MVTKERIKYYDTLRFIAIIAVIGIHVFQDWHNAGLINNSYCLNEIFRFGVPIFLMLTGALLLNKKIELKDFFKRRFIRIIYPFILFFFVRIIVFFIIGNFTSLKINNSINPLEYNWYFWLILGTYFFIPIINKFVQNANIKEIEYFVLVILGATFIYQITYYFSILNYIDLNFFIGPISYLILGYYLSIKEFKISTKKIIVISLILFILTTILKGYSQIIIPYGLFHNFEIVRNVSMHSFLDLGFIQLIQAGALFVLIKNIYNSSSGVSGIIKRILEYDKINKFIVSGSKASYGIYLFHHTLIDPIALLLSGLVLTKSQIYGGITIEILGAFFISWIVILIINKIPYINKLSGYH